MMLDDVGDTNPFEFMCFSCFCFMVLSLAGPGCYSNPLPASSHSFLGFQHLRPPAS